MAKVKYIVIHCADTPPGMDIGAEEIDAWHKERGWKNIGYHYVIKLDGTPEKGRELDTDSELEANEIGAHAYGYNGKSVAVCYVGGKGGDTRTNKQKDSLIHAVSTLKMQFPEAKVVGHCDLDEKKPHCPGFDAKNEYSDINPLS
jgi:hypothetical protein